MKPRHLRPWTDRFFIVLFVLHLVLLLVIYFALPPGPPVYQDQSTDTDGRLYDIGESLLEFFENMKELLTYTWCSIALSVVVSLGFLFIVSSPSLNPLRESNLLEEAHSHLQT